MASHCIDLVDENDTGRILLTLLEQIAYAARADADEHLDKVRTRDGEKWDVGFACDGARQQRLARSRRSNQQNAFGDAASELLELLRLPQEFDDLLQLFLSFLYSRNIFERNLLLLRGMQS